jgi:hypothetical protein
MIFQHLLPMNPAEAEEINDEVGYVERDGVRIYYVLGVAVYVHREGDSVGERVARVQLLSQGAVTKEELSRAFEVTTTTLYRQELRVEDEGIAGLLDKKRGPHGPHKMSEARIEKAQQLADEGFSKRAIARELGVSPAAVRLAFKDGRLRGNRGSLAKGRVVGPRSRSEIDFACTNGVAVKRDVERAMAMEGLLQEAAPEFQAAEGVSGAGVLIALPMLLDLGLIEVAERVYSSLKNGFYGLRHVLLLLALMTLLRIRTPEQLSKNAPGELGILLGLDRIPEVKTVRRKLNELAGREKAYEYGRFLAKRWTEEDPEAVGILYLDGHVRAYHGKQKLPKTWISSRHLAAPATTDFWVNDIYSQPLFVVTAVGNEGLRDMVRDELLSEIRALVGKDRRVTLCFDREGWSQKFFKNVHDQNFDVLTYRRGTIEAWPQEEFQTVEGNVEGRQLKYQLAEREVEVIHGFTMREVRRLCESGHQTAILTTRRDLPIAVLAYRMFNRWAQENYFKYMGENFAIDHLWQQGAEGIDSAYLVPNPARKHVQKQLVQTREKLKKLEKAYGTWMHPLFSDRRKKHGLSRKRMAEQITQLRRQADQLRSEMKKLPLKISLANMPSEERIVRLRYEVKHLVDTIKLVAYRAESRLFQLLHPLGSRIDQEGRALLQEILTGTADVLPDSETHRLRICFHSLANPRSNLILARLCEIMNQAKQVYPGTNLILEYQPPASKHAQISDACQEV